MNKNNKNDTTHKSEINATMAFTQTLAFIVKRQNQRQNDNEIFAA